MSRSNFTLLYVDDEAQNLISFKAAFRREYEVLTAGSGQEGMDIMHKNDVQVVISDQRMPHMTGVEFLEQVRLEFPDTIRMVLTGFSDVEAIIQAINNGQVFRYITKPWDETELRMTLENARNLYELKARNQQLLLDLQHQAEQQEKTLNLFMKYVPEPVVKQALSAAGDSIFNGEERHIAVLFCDIRGFTSLSEQLEPHEVVQFLNAFYGTMSAIIHRHNGAVNQYVGDEIFATFGAPLAHPQNEQNAVYCALEMVQRLSDLNSEYESRFERPIQVGIGINAGSVVAGNMGSEDRINYSVTGRTVNTGQWLESLTKETPNGIFISEAVHQKVKHIVAVEKTSVASNEGSGDPAVYQVIRRK